MKKTSWFLILLLFAVSCLDEPDCYLLNNDVVGIAFGVIGSSRPDTVQIESATVNGLLLLQETTVDFLPVVVDRFTDRTVLEIISHGRPKLVNLDYDVKVQFVSEDCGPRYVLSNLQAPEHDFDSLAVVNATPGRESNSLNIRILRCPDPDSISVSLFQLTLPETGKTTSRSATVRLNALTIDGSQIFYENTSASSFILPLNDASAESTFDFDLADGFGFENAIRRLHLGYKVTNKNRYRVCGFQNFIDTLFLKTSEGTAFDSVSFNVVGRDTLWYVTDPISTNLNIYRCPPTNEIQISFVNDGTSAARTITSITSDYDNEVLVADTRASRVTLPLNPNGTSTTFTIEYEGGTETVSLNYGWSDPRVTLFKPGRACSSRKVITNLSEGTDNPNVSVVEPLVLYPSVINVTLEVAD